MRYSAYEAVRHCALDIAEPTGVQYANLHVRAPRELRVCSHLS